MNLRLLALALMLTVASQSMACAQESKPWWNPFASSDSSTSSVRESKQFGKSGAAAPQFKLSPWSKSKTSPKSNKPSMFSSVSSTTKKWWDNTVDFMNPFDDKPKAKTNGYQPQVQKKKGKGMFGWMTQEETTERPTTVNEFLGGSKMPGFDR